MQRALVIVNPLAGSGRAREQALRLTEELRRRGLTVEAVATTRPGQALELAGAAAVAYDSLIAAGGDGTVNEIANGLLQATAPRAALGILPLGTGNDVAQLAGIRGLDTALDAVTRGVAQAMDVIEVRCHDAGRPAVRFALLFAAAGFAGDLLRHATPRVKRLLGPRYCYSVGFLRAVFTFRAPVMQVESDEVALHGRMFLVCAGNSEYAGGGVMRLSPGARIDDGKLNVSLIGALGRWEALRYFPKLLTGDHLGHPKLRYFTATTVAIAADPPIELQLDGDLFGQTPARFTVKPGALKVLSARRLS